LVQAADGVVMEAADRLPPDPASTAVLQLLGDGALRNAVASRGWHRAPVAADVYALHERLAGSRQILPGHLRMVSAAAALIVSAIDGAHSAQYMSVFLDRVWQNRDRLEFVRRTDGRRVLDGMRGVLRDVTFDEFFGKRNMASGKANPDEPSLYAVALHAQQFIDDVVSTLIARNDRSLLKLTKAREIDISESIQEIRHHVNSSGFSGEDKSRLEERIKRIERSRPAVTAG
jgi:hypothetical protein